VAKALLIAALLKNTSAINIHLIDIGTIPDDEIKKHGKVALLEMVEKHIRDRDTRLAYELGKMLNETALASELFKNMLYFLVNKGEMEDFELFLKILIDTIEDKTYKESAMTIAEQLENKGFQKGIHAGIEQGIEKGEHEAKLAIAKNMLAKNSDINFVKEVTGLSDQDLAKLSKNH
jgi:predicted transposase/invertase (TIGR01784 family)